MHGALPQRSACAHKCTFGRNLIFPLSCTLALVCWHSLFALSACLLTFCTAKSNSQECRRGLACASSRTERESAASPRPGSSTRYLTLWPVAKSGEEAVPRRSCEYAVLWCRVKRGISRVDCAYPEQGALSLGPSTSSLGQCNHQHSSKRHDRREIRRTISFRHTGKR